MYYLEMIEAHRKQLGLSEGGYEKKCGLPKGIISKWRTKGFHPNAASQKKLADFMRISIAELMGEEGPLTAEAIVREKLTLQRENFEISLPTLSPEGRAGCCARLVSIISEENIDPRDCFSFDMPDNSMEPAYIKGDILFAAECIDPFHIEDSAAAVSGLNAHISSDGRIISGESFRRPSVNSGDIVIVDIPGAPLVCRKVYLQGNGMILQPLNNRYEPVYYSRSEADSLPIFISGKVISMIRLSIN